MTLTKFVGLLAGSAAITGFAQAENNDALAQIAELRAELASIKSQNGDNWLTEARASEIRGIVTDVLADADTRSSFQGSAATSGYDNGFFISSADGNFRLNVGFLGQFGWGITDTDGDTNTVSGFALSDMVVSFSGHVVDNTWQYYTEIVTTDYDNYEPLSGEDTTGFRQITMTKDFGSGFSVTGGNFRAPFLRSSLLGDANQLGIGYSEVDDEYSAGYRLGANVNYKADKWQVTYAFVNNTDDTGTNPGDSFVRGEILFAGDWAQFDKDVSFRGESFGFLLGAAYAYETESGGSNYTIDATAMFGGASIGAAWVQEEYDSFGDDANGDNWGFELFGDYMITENLDIFVDWDQFGTASTEYETNDLDVGVNWYFNGTATRWTNEIQIPLHADSGVNFSFGTQLQISF